MQINKHKVVTLTYTLTLDNGNIADATSDDQPFVFIHGIGQTLPLFEQNLENLISGDEFEFRIDAANGYGFSNDEYKVNIPREVFNAPGVPADVVQIGNMVPMQDQEGNPMNGTILSFDDTNVLIDFNHPLADEDLTFKGKVISVREATPEELDHGHVHGPGGHHH